MAAYCPGSKNLGDLASILFFGSAQDWTNGE